MVQERMISMTLDKDNEVALQTLKLLLLISKWVLKGHTSNSLLLFFFFVKCSYTCPLRTPEEVFSSDDYKILLQCVYSSQRPLAATAGELLLSRYVDLEMEQKTN